MDTSLAAAAALVRGRCGKVTRARPWMADAVAAAVLGLTGCGGGQPERLSTDTPPSMVAQGAHQAQAQAPAPGPAGTAMPALGGTYAFRLAGSPDTYMDVDPTSGTAPVLSRVLPSGTPIPLSARFSAMPAATGTPWYGPGPAPSGAGCLVFRTTAVATLSNPIFYPSFDPRDWVSLPTDRVLTVKGLGGLPQSTTVGPWNARFKGASPVRAVCPVAVAGGVQLQVWPRGDPVELLRLRDGAVEAVTFDGSAAMAAQSTWQAVVVKAPGQAIAPTVSLRVPARRLAWSDLGNAVVAVDAADTDGEVTAVEVFDGGVRVGGSDMRPWDTVLRTTVRTGPHRFYARVTDHSGQVTLGAPVDVDIDPGPAPAGHVPPVGILHVDGRAVTTVPPMVAGGLLPLRVRLDSPAVSAGSAQRIELLDGDAVVAGLVQRFEGADDWVWSGSPGLHALRLRVTDVYGNVTLGPVLSVSVRPASPAEPMPPLVVLSVEGGGERGPEATTRQITASPVADPAGAAQGDIAYVAFYEGNRYIGATSQAPYSIPWRGERGIHVLSARAVTAKGLSRGSSGLTYEITLGVPPPKVSDPGVPMQPSLTVASPGRVTEGTPVALQAFLTGVDLQAVDRLEFSLVYANGWSEPLLPFIGSVRTAPFQVVWAHAQRGDWKLRVKVIGRGGQPGLSADSALFSVVSASRAVAAGIFQPLDRTALVLGQGLVLQGTATGADGTRASASRPRFLVNGVEAAPQAYLGNAFSHDWMPTAAGRYHIVVSARDPATGREALSMPVVVDVVEPGSAPPAGTLHQAPRVSIRQPADGTRVVAGRLVTIQVDATDPGGAPLAGLSLRSASGDLTLRAPPWDFHWVARPPGTVTARAVAMNAQGTMSFTAPWRLVVDPAANQPPTVSITSPAQGFSLASGSAYTVRAVATDADGAVRSVEFLANGRSLGVARQAPWKVTGVAATAGSFQLIARATDGQGAVAISPPVRVQVTGASVVR